jgi:hypothetical protein
MACRRWFEEGYSGKGAQHQLIFLLQASPRFSIGIRGQHKGLKGKGSEMIDKQDASGLHVPALGNAAAAVVS